MDDDSITVTFTRDEFEALWRLAHPMHRPDPLKPNAILGALSKLDMARDALGFDFSTRAD